MLLGFNYHHLSGHQIKGEVGDLWVLTAIEHSIEIKLLKKVLGPVFVNI